MTGTELQIIPPLHAEISGSTAERLPEVHTNATTDLDLLAVWLKSHADGSAHTRRAYARIGHRFVEALAAAGSNLKRATVEDVQTALEAMRIKADGSMSSAATVNTYVAAVKALLGFAHKVGLTRFNAAPLIKLRKAPRKTAQRLLSQVELHLLIRAARSRRDRLMLFCSSTGRAARERLHVLPNSSSHMVVMIPMIVMPIMPIMMVVIVMNLIDDAR